VASPGEVNQVIGRAYQYVFIGALEANIRYFQNKFNVHEQPEKTSFTSRTGKGYSFDFNGSYFHPMAVAEVFGECKGYSKGGGLLSEFKSFLAKAYVTSVDNARHRQDYFWFVTNVPFACTEGSAIRSYEFVNTTLRDKNSEQVTEILGKGQVDDNLVRSLADRVGVFILTDSYLMNTDILYTVESGESLWVILKKIHAGTAPRGFGSVAKHIASRNRLRSPDHIVSGQKLRMSWCGINKSGTESNFGQ
jgi:hypothetical protein